MWRYTYRIANLISKLNFYKLIHYPMDQQGPPIQPRYQPTGGLHSTRQQKRCYDVMLSGQKGSTRWHLANAHSVTGPASSIYRMSFFGVWWDRSHPQPTSIPHNPAAAINRSHPNQHPYHIIQQQRSIGGIPNQRPYHIIQWLWSIEPTWKQISTPNSLLNNSWKPLL